MTVAVVWRMNCGWYEKRSREPVRRFSKSQGEERCGLSRAGWGVGGQCRWRQVETSQMFLEAELTRLADGFVRG